MTSLPAQLDLNLLFMRVLAVAGGAAVGYALVGVLIRLVGRFAFRNKLPRLVHLVVRVLGAVAGALLVWLWLSGGLGSGLGGGGGLLPFGGSGPGGGSDQVQPTAPAPKPPEAPQARGEAVEVVMLGGKDVQGQRFYMLAGEEKPLTFEEVTARIKERQKNPAVKDLHIDVLKESVDQHHQAVTQLKKWAQENGLTPRVATP